MSPSYGGLCTDRFIVEDTNIAAKFTPDFLVLFEKGFNVQDIFLPFKAKCVERVVGRLKEFRPLENKLPINMIDMCDHIWNIAAVIVNLQPPLVK